MRKRILCCLGLIALCGVGLAVHHYWPERTAPSVAAAAIETVGSTPSRLRTLWTLSRLAKRRARDDNASEVAPPAARAAPRDPREEERKIAESPALLTVVEKAGLQPEDARAIAHILAVHASSRDSLNAALSGDEQLATLQEQILDDTVVQLRTHIPDSAWETFEHSGLLALSARGDAPAGAVNN